MYTIRVHLPGGVIQFEDSIAGVRIYRPGDREYPGLVAHIDTSPPPKAVICYEDVDGANARIYVNAEDRAWVMYARGKVAAAVW